MLMRLDGQVCRTGRTCGTCAAQDASSCPVVSLSKASSRDLPGGREGQALILSAKVLGTASPARAGAPPRQTTFTLQHTDRRRPPIDLSLAKGAPPYPGPTAGAQTSKSVPALSQLGCSVAFCRVRLHGALFFTPARCSARTAAWPAAESPTAQNPARACCACSVCSASGVVPIPEAPQC